MKFESRKGRAKVMGSELRNSEYFSRSGLIFRIFCNFYCENRSIIAKVDNFMQIWILHRICSIRKKLCVLS